jgi:hypothetical protein
MTSGKTLLAAKAIHRFSETLVPKILCSWFESREIRPKTKFLMRTASIQVPARISKRILRRAAQLQDEELAFLIQVGRIIRQCRLANQNPARLDRFLAEYDRRYQQQDTKQLCRTMKRKRHYHL